VGIVFGSLPAVLVNCTSNDILNLEEPCPLIFLVLKRGARGLLFFRVKLNSGLVSVSALSLYKTHSDNVNLYVIFAK
jgi:hypothetical protein